jgi:hypothetical protein
LESILFREQGKEKRYSRLVGRKWKGYCRVSSSEEWHLLHSQQHVVTGGQGGDHGGVTEHLGEIFPSASAREERAE